MIFVSSLVEDAPKTRVKSEAKVAAPPSPRIRPKASLVIPSLDGLRAVSFLMVFLAHAGAPGMPGGFGVTVFFFLSGYLITTLTRVEMEETGGVSLRHFYLRRVLRILPPFYILLGTATALAWAGFLWGELRTPAVLAQVFHYSNIWIAGHGWKGIAAGTGVLWSLAVEEHFYLGFPALFVVLHRFGIRGKQMAITFWILCGVVLLWRTILVFYFHAPQDRTFIVTDARFDSMLFGCALAVFGNPALDDTERPLPPIWTRVLLPAGLAVLLFTFVVRSGDFRETAIRLPKSGVYRFLNIPFVRHLGVLSYSLYLGHHVIIDGVNKHVAAGTFPKAVLSLALSLLFAETMYRVVEKPCAKLRRRFSKVA